MQISFLHLASCFLQKKGASRNDLLSHTATSAVPSALRRFTSRFGMELGGSTSLESREAPYWCHRQVVKETESRGTATANRQSLCTILAFVRHSSKPSA